MDAEHRTGLQFFAEALGAVLLLALTTAIAHRVHFPPGTALYLVAQLVPIVPVWLMLLALLRHYRRIDELQRLQFLQSLSLTAGIMAGLAWSYPAIQRAFALHAPPEMWEVPFSVLFVVISALMTKIRVAPRAG